MNIQDPDRSDQRTRRTGQARAAEQHPATRDEAVKSEGGRICGEAGRVCRLRTPELGADVHRSCPSDVTAAVQAQVSPGTTFFAAIAMALRSPKRSSRRCPAPNRCASCCSGTESRPLRACRAARAFRKRDKILKFEGGYTARATMRWCLWRPRTPATFRAARLGLGRYPQVGDRRDGGRRLQRHRDGRKPDRGAGRMSWPASSSSLPAADPAQASVSCRRCAPADRQAWHSVDLRRGRHRLPLRLWRGTGILRR